MLEPHKILATQTNQEDDTAYEPAKNSKWLVAIGICGTVVVLKAPNIHFSYFENGKTAEDIGLPESSTDEVGVYEWTCFPEYTRDWESGREEFEGFIVTSSRKIEM